MPEVMSIRYKWPESLKVDFWLLHTNLLTTSMHIQLQLQNCIEILKDKNRAQIHKAICAPSIKRYVCLVNRTIKDTSDNFRSAIVKWEPILIRTDVGFQKKFSQTTTFSYSAETKSNLPC